MARPELEPWFAALAARLEQHDHAGAIDFLVQRSAELLAVPGGAEALVTFLAEARAARAPRDRWALLGDLDLEALGDLPPTDPVDHALAAFSRLELDRALEPRPCAHCAGGDPVHAVARACHLQSAGRFQDAFLAAAPVAEATTHPAPLRILAGLVAARAVLRRGDPIDGRRRLASLRDLLAGAWAPVPPPLAALLEIHELRAQLSAGIDLPEVASRAEALAAEAPAPHVRALARRLHAYAEVMLGRPPRQTTFEAGPEAYLDGAEIAALAGARVPMAPLLAMAAACARDGHRYLEARARVLAAMAGLAEGSPAARSRADKELGAARRLCLDEGYEHLTARCDVLSAIGADRADATTHERRLDSLLETSPTETIVERLAAAALHRLPLEQLPPQDRQFLDVLGYVALPAFSVDDGSGPRLVGSLDLERWLGRADLVVDLDRGELVARGKVVRGQARIVSLLAHLVAAGARAVEADELFRGVWNARSYAPLRHRNAVYLAIARSRRILGPLLGDAPIVRHPNGWRLRDDLYAVVVRAVGSVTATARSSGT